MLTIVRSNRFLKDLRLAKKRNLDLSELDDVVMKLANQENLKQNITIMLYPVNIKILENVI